MMENKDYFISHKRFSYLIKAFLGDKYYFFPCIFTILNAVFTYFALTSDILSVFGNNDWGLYGLFALNGLFITILTTRIISNIYYLRKSTKDSPDGSRFRYRLVLIFTLAAVLPALMMAIFSAITFKKAADGWFAVEVEKAIYNAQSVSEAYIHEHNNNIRADSFAASTDLLRILNQAEFSVQNLLQQMRLQLLLRDLSQIILYSDTGHPIAYAYSQKYQLTLKDNNITPPNLLLSHILSAKRERPFVALEKDKSRVFALLPILSGNNVFILRIDRLVNMEAVKFQKNTSEAVTNYESIKSKRRAAEIGFALIYISFGLAAVTFMIYAGMYFATHMTRPLEELTDTVREIEKGNPTARMPEPDYIQDEIDRLISAFNKMANSLDERKQELISTNLTLDAKHRLTEAVLGGVSSGVLGIHDDGRILLINHRASNILALDKVPRMLQDISSDLSLEILSLLGDTQKFSRHHIEHTYYTPQQDARHLHIRLSPCDKANLEDDNNIDVVITIDDVTELVKAQSMSAWRDVARRIAHEIKNPLTPISLSVERIRRKWGHIISFDRPIFDECVETVLRQVEHIRETADSFSAFAKTPTPICHDIQVIDIIKNVIFLEQMRCHNIHYNISYDNPDIIILADDRLLSQALINIMKNASEAIEARPAPAPQGAISITVNHQDNHCIITITDNGVGLPSHIPSYKLFEPYVTEREEGTGLGLAITAKIITDHNGKISLNRNEETDGTVVRITLPCEKI